MFLFMSSLLCGSRLVMLFYLVFCFFFSSRRRHTRCALVMEFRRVLFRSPPLVVIGPKVTCVVAVANVSSTSDSRTAVRVVRSEERRVGKECVSTCRSRWSPYH